MKAFEVAAKLLKLAEEHGDPHVYSYGQMTDCVLGVEPENIEVVDLGTGLSPMLLIVGTPLKIEW